MDVQAHIQRLCKSIVEKFRPQKVILFGSYAHGSPTYDSDIDLMIVMPYSGNELDKMVEVRRVLDSEIPLDVFVKTQEQIDDCIAMEDVFVANIIKNGKVIYESGNVGLDR